MVFYLYSAGGHAEMPAPTPALPVETGVSDVKRCGGNPGRRCRCLGRSREFDGEHTGVRWMPASSPNLLEPLARASFASRVGAGVRPGVFARTARGTRDYDR